MGVLRAGWDICLETVHCFRALCVSAIISFRLMASLEFILCIRFFDNFVPGSVLGYLFCIIFTSKLTMRKPV